MEKRSKKQGWDVFLRTPGNRKRLLLIVLTSFFSQCSGNGIASYYLHDILESVGVTKPYDQSLVNGGLQIWSFLVAIGFSQLVDRVGRRKLFLIAAVGMLISFSVWTGCSAIYAQTGNSGAGGAVIAMVFLFYFVAGFAWPGLTVAYVAEVGLLAKRLSKSYRQCRALIYSLRARMLTQTCRYFRSTSEPRAWLSASPARQPHQYSIR